MAVPLSMLDLAQIRKDQTPGDSLTISLEVARRAERFGYRRVWYAEHHNSPSIASSATSVLIAHIASHTDSIHVGSGGVMLPNHSPLVIAEQFGTLETLYPGRIDLGLGRAPGTGPETIRALRRNPAASEHFPEDIVELQGYLSGSETPNGVNAIPGKGTKVPLYILGSSMFGAHLAAFLGLPYTFASHFAPEVLQEAVAAYRSEFRPSAQLDAPYVIAGVNAIVAEESADARVQLQDSMRYRVRSRFGRDRSIGDEEADQILLSPSGWQIQQMATYSAVGTRAEVKEYIEAFTKHADADELIVVFPAPETEARLRSIEMLAEAVEQG